MHYTSLSVPFAVRCALLILWTGLNAVERQIIHVLRLVNWAIISVVDKNVIKQGPSLGTKNRGNDRTPYPVLTIETVKIVTSRQRSTHFLNVYTAFP